MGDMALMGGFTEWAHLRLRDHRPGPMSYTPPPSDIPQRSILRKYAARMPDSGAGPGEYQIPTTVGQCRSTVFGPPCGPSPATDAADSEAARTPRKTAARRGPVQPLPKQYSLALTPDTPAFTIYSKIQEKPAGIMVGPGEYTIPSEFGQVGKGPHFGLRTKLPGPCESAPGPAAYNVPRFGDEKPKRKEYISSIRRVRDTELSPGPGSYDDPTTIAARLAPPKRRLYDGPHFGGRYSTLKSTLASGPGPAQYGDLSRVLQKGPKRTPVFRPPLETVPAGKTPRAVANAGPGPGDYQLPSEFDQDFRKGVTVGARTFHAPKRSVGDALGPGSYNLGKPPMTSNGFRFAARPFDPFAIDESDVQTPDDAAEGVSGPGMYNPNLDAVRPSTYRAVGGFGLGERFPEMPAGGPLCYNVRPPTSNAGTVFYRGDYSRSRQLKKQENGGLLYNVENGTIAESVRSGKGCTFGIRYPARATHQVCKPYDETTNMNCQYDDEVTWTTKLM
ncbi:hypothetical protein DQ04_04541030 [Trypanosoma grayi]|uniref:hypothetical protein n=1 Tax=Trypanosoma grayi TaxID=71804 RepID=UPI0004F40BC7|nr:hypothetical protein DQ04_04541030 [Trypanosoma grayi]KEG09846.1 hypothetical protein DQ04_04541030 [Trypanosoma grayi]